MKILEQISLEVAKLLNGLTAKEQHEVFVRAQQLLDIEPVPDSVNAVFCHWNAQGVIKHLAITRERHKAIKQALKNYPETTVKEAIATYADILQGEQYFFKYRWTLEDFLKRGLERFVDREAAIRNYSRKLSAQVRYQRAFNPQNYFSGRYGHVVKGNPELI